MIEHDMMIHPGMSMNMPVAVGHLAVGITLHLAFSMVVGVVLITVLFALRRVGRVARRARLHGRLGGGGGAAVCGDDVPGAAVGQPAHVPHDPKGAVFIGHLIYGLIFGLVAYPLARRAAASST